ncbi:MAG TPA: DUF2905 domain-containing protein [Vicinamibacterales bacterium]|nr:DUF2905 domain-containing protein [Vicinamibacterales bacterium]
MGKLLIVVGLVIAALGLAVTMGLPIGRLPGDFTFRRGPVTFYFPLTTGVVLSVLLTLLLALIRR